MILIDKDLIEKAFDLNNDDTKLSNYLMRLSKKDRSTVINILRNKKSK